MGDDADFFMTHEEKGLSPETRKLLRAAFAYERGNVSFDAVLTAARGYANARSPSEALLANRAAVQEVKRIAREAGLTFPPGFVEKIENAVEAGFLA